MVEYQSADLHSCSDLPLNFPVRSGQVDAQIRIWYELVAIIRSIFLEELCPLVFACEMSETYFQLVQIHTDCPSFSL